MRWKPWATSHPSWNRSVRLPSAWPGRPLDSLVALGSGAGETVEDREASGWTTEEQSETVDSIELERVEVLSPEIVRHEDDGGNPPPSRGRHPWHPETRDPKIVEERYLVRQDCPAFAPGSYRSRPGVETPFDGVAIAGDFVKLPIPTALMERATASGFLAANQLLARHHVRSEPILSVPPQGLLARLPI